jgi:cytochrome c5
MKNIPVLLAGSVILLLICCTSSKKANKTYEPSNDQLQAAVTRWPDASAADLKEGQKIFYNECTECHKAYSIPGFSERKWKHEIDDMSPKAKLSDVQKDKLTRYILSMRDVTAPKAN